MPTTRSLSSCLGQALRVRYVTASPKRLTNSSPFRRACLLPRLYHASRSTASVPAQERKADISTLLTRYDNSKVKRDTPIEADLFELSDYVPINDIYEQLGLVASQGHYEEVERIVHYLVTTRNEQPNAKIYSALILVNVDSEKGSAKMVESLLQEMEAEGVEINSGICHNVLEALAVHPDYLLRNDIVNYMRQRWFTITSEGHHHIAVSLIRDSQLELALSKMDAMANHQIPVQPWLYDMAGYALAEAGEIEMALELIKYRVAEDESKIPLMQWYHLLDQASSMLHHEATVYAWKKQVQLSYINPASGVCYNVLNTAARHTDTQLASDVFRVLGNRNSTFDIHHYEMLVDTFAEAGDLEGALTLLCIAHSSNIVLDECSTRSVVTFLKKNPDKTIEAFELLRNIHKEGRSIPTIAVNSIIEASINIPNLEQAFNQYKDLHTICSDGPSVSTFNLLFRACRNARQKKMGNFLISEMAGLRVQPTALTYERVIEMCLAVGEHDTAIGYYEEMKAQDMYPKSGTCELMVKDCIERNDPRFWYMLDEMNQKRRLLLRVKTALIHKGRHIPRPGYPPLEGLSPERPPPKGQVKYEAHQEEGEVEDAMSGVEFPKTKKKH